MVDVPHDVTQRGNARRLILDSDADRLVYLSLLREYIVFHEVSLLAYCLMSSHVHLVVIPRKKNSLALAMKQTHGQYATYWNAGHKSSGHAWQGRFYSCPLDTAHQWAAMRYAELKPVRAGLVRVAEDWRWSSAAAHCGEAPGEELLAMELWQGRWNSESWREYLRQANLEEETARIRECTHTGRPLGTAEFIATLEAATERCLTAKKGGRPKNRREENGQRSLAFMARSEPSGPGYCLSSR
jgi:putative transposase